MAYALNTLRDRVAVTPASGTPLPILFASPHSGRIYPDDFGSIQPVAILRRAEDAYVDELVGGAADQGVTVVAALFPRAYLDVNRDETDLDPAIVDSPEPVQTGEKSKLGIGLVRRVVTPDYPIYDRRLPISAVQRRIELCYRPYHAALSEELGKLEAEGGRTVFVDWHSMKSAGNAATPDGPGARRPDIVIGDLRGASCSGELTRLVAAHFTQLGFSVSINAPYAGGATLRRYGRPATGVHALQIEMNRALYLDEETVEKTAGVGRLSEAILTLVPKLAVWCA